MSVLETCRRQARSAIDFVSRTLRAFGNRALPTPWLVPSTAPRLATPRSALMPSMLTASMVTATPATPKPELCNEAA